MPKKRPDVEEQAVDAGPQRQISFQSSRSLDDFINRLDGRLLRR